MNHLSELPKDIQICIFKWCEDKEFSQLNLVNKKYNIFICENYKEFKNKLACEIHDLSKEIFTEIYSQSEKNEKVIKLQKLQVFYKHMSNLFGSIENFLRLPVLTFKKEMMGSDYIDRVRPDHMSVSVMRGKDDWERNFFTIKAAVTDSPKVCQTFFERYSDGAGLSAGGHRIINVISYLYFSSGLIADKEAYAELKELLKEHKLVKGNRSIILS